MGSMTAYHQLPHPQQEVSGVGGLFQAQAHQAPPSPLLHPHPQSHLHSFEQDSTMNSDPTLNKRIKSDIISKIQKWES